MTGNEVARLHGLLAELKHRAGDPRTLAAATAATGWPRLGVYFFFEAGEVREDGAPRVVRVGTHALRASSRTTLWKRLAQHRGNPGGRSTGGGNHRGSVFRLHVGEALIARDGPVPGSESWGRGAKATPAIRVGEVEHERLVSRTIGAMPMLWLGVDDDPGPLSDRGLIERTCISILARDDDPPSAAWLGRSSTRSSIRTSGLWNVNHVAEQTRADGLDALERWVLRTTRHVTSRPYDTSEMGSSGGMDS
jgi:hypothetical protein